MSKYEQYFRAYLLYYGTDPTSTPTVLAMGNYEVEFLNEARLYIIDSVGDFTMFIRNVTVRHLLITPEGMQQRHGGKTLQ